MRVAHCGGVTPTPVREALNRLQQDGLVNRTDRGMIVRERTPEEILDIYETRIALEGTAARLSAERHAPMDQRRLTRLLTLAEESDDSPNTRADRNRDFHRGIWLASHNESLIDLLDRLNMHLLRYPVSTLSVPGRWEESLREHRELLEAILARDPGAAQKLAEQHFSAARDIRLALWEENIV
jgi:DNA-binding GntR family transcriptional regulator